jgi:hypothetical protein
LEEKPNIGDFQKASKNAEINNANLAKSTEIEKGLFIHKRAMVFS